jgi:hypothetical protein
MLVDRPPILRCPECGNGDYFIEVMDHEAHIVDGNLNYIRLLDAQTDHYICTECQATIEWEPVDTLPEPTR